MSEQAAILTEKLTKHYGNFPALVDLDLEVRSGEIFGFLGPNGAGKTTMIRTITPGLASTRTQEAAAATRHAKVRSHRPATQRGGISGCFPSERAHCRALAVWGGNPQCPPNLSQLSACPEPRFSRAHRAKGIRRR